MLPNTADSAKRIIIGRYTEWIKRFDVGEYVDNPPMIEKLYEEKQLALVESLSLKEQLELLEDRFHYAEKEKLRLEMKLNEATRRSNLIFVLTLVATVLVGIGVNFATSNPDNWTGWTMIVAACAIETVAFFAQTRKDE